VSCPDWRGLAALRRQEPQEDAEPAGWAAAVAHFDACPRCRREALLADPLLVFRRLPAAELDEAAERSEVETMRQAVTAMRTARRLDSRRRFTGWRRWAAAAVLALAALSASSESHDRSPLELLAPSPAPLALAPLALAPLALAPLAPAAGPDAGHGQETLEGLNRPAARVYQMSGKNLSVVWIVDKSLDV
jgi:hypothetical protein